MTFVYVHAAWFALWIGFRVEEFPFGLLTMMVSLEAIFLSTFLLISQNRQDERRQVLADEEWRLVQEQARENELEIKQNGDLLDLSRRIFDLTTAIHDLTSRWSEGAAPPVEPAPAEGSGSPAAPTGEVR
jgi:uncharacterized membrane protein